MTTKVVPGMLIAVSTPEEVAKEAASRIAKALREALKQRMRGASAPQRPHARASAVSGSPQEWQGAADDEVPR